jgi:hypothetical protein
MIGEVRYCVGLRLPVSSWPLFPAVVYAGIGLLKNYLVGGQPD